MGRELRLVPEGRRVFGLLSGQLRLVKRVAENAGGWSHPSLWQRSRETELLIVFNILYLDNSGNIFNLPFSFPVFGVDRSVLVFAALIPIFENCLFNALSVGYCT